jgi:hypothetical protein
LGKLACGRRSRPQAKIRNSSQNKFELISEYPASVNGHELSLLRNPPFLLRGERSFLARPVVSRPLYRLTELITEKQGFCFIELVRENIKFRGRGYFGVFKNEVKNKIKTGLKLIVLSCENYLRILSK